MKFIREPTGYTKTAISDLQGAWSLLRDQVVSEFGFEGSDKLLFHIDELGMCEGSWSNEADHFNYRQYCKTIKCIR
jgi:hypothetical protein